MPWHRNRIIQSIASVLIALFAGWACAEASFDAKQPWRAEVTYVTDGDTLWVRPEAGSPPRKLRLDGIDAPEICQVHGVAAREALMRRVLHRQVMVSSRATDDYQRTLVTLHLDGEDLGRWMVAQGHAWSYRYHRSAGPYAAEEKSARRAGRGLFADVGAERPRDFRKSHGSCYPSKP
ncbi:hypothetical protein RD110_08325 [Rhodoferax koreense]|uniref:TNase-like domain-containing protein n=1 Tax=Rhodoferax koreensis TaxID=1842727 RepID=A0A1P8JTX3_9BURK|nr:thermonuclease family protein [Rhodoferax koreense]APW37204.1 hypothetical protein RD110_08325 [Rhodoferax koreense]